jgi:BirA family transcriptional regulator, biotin operon repressor / biotin---[acetyl-CoA-carboxylase] ligase
MIPNLIVLPETESTQDVAREMAASGAPEGTAIMAFNQTKGRGRFGHTWISPSGKNVAMSLILRPRMAPGEAVLLGLVAGVAAANVVEKHGISGVGLKWPNDVLVKEKKIAGILSEASLDGGEIHYIVIGLGLNVNTQQSDFTETFPVEATSLLMCTGKLWDVEAIARSFLAEISLLYQRVRIEGSRIIPGLWQARWAHRGRIVVHDGMTGVAEALAPDGALILKSYDGTQIRIVAGEVSPVAC